MCVIVAAEDVDAVGAEGHEAVLLEAGFEHREDVLEEFLRGAMAFAAEEVGEDGVGGETDGASNDVEVVLRMSEHILLHLAQAVGLDEFGESHAREEIDSAAELAGIDLHIASDLCHTDVASGVEDVGYRVTKDAASRGFWEAIEVLKGHKGLEWFILHCLKGLIGP